MRSLVDRCKECAVTCFGLGYAPIAPGTFGTLGGVAVAAALVYFAPDHYAWAVAVAVVVLSLLGASLGKWAERRYGRKDPGAFVLDEVAGYLLAAWALDAPSAAHLALAFFLFRLTDIIKPWPARNLEKLSGGWGIVADDLAAGVWAWAILALLHPILLT